MQTMPSPDPYPLDALPLPKHVELIDFSLKLEQLQSTGEIIDAVLAARSLDFVAGLIAVLNLYRLDLGSC